MTIAALPGERGFALAFIRAIKAGFDPDNILNPGKMLPAGNQRG